MVQSSPVIDAWLNELAWEQRADFTSDLAIWESQLTEMMTRSGFDALTPQRVALVCDLIDQIAAHVGRWAPILRRIVRELFGAVFQGYSEEDLEERVPIWSKEGASWIGWQTPTFGNTLDVEELDLAPAFHPLSPLSDPHMYGPSHGGSANDHPDSSSSSHPHAHLSAPAKPSGLEPPPQHFFRQHLWELNMATWADITAKYESAQRDLAAHRARVAADLGMTLTEDGQRIVVGPSPGATPTPHDADATPTSASLQPRPPPTVAGVTRRASVEIGDEKHAGSLTVPPGRARLRPLDTEQDDVLSPLQSPRVIMSTQSVGSTVSPAHSSTSSSSSTAGGDSVFAGVSASCHVPPHSTRHLHRPSSRAVTFTSASSPSASPLLGSSPPGNRPMSSMRLQRQHIIDGAKSAALADREAHLHARTASQAFLASGGSPLPSPRASPRAEPITAQSMAILESASVGALVEQAMLLTQPDASPSHGGGADQHHHQLKPRIGSGSSQRWTQMSPSQPPVVEEKEATGPPPSVSRHPSLLTTHQPILAAPIPALTVSSSLSDTAAATAAAFQTIHSLISTPPIPSHSLIAYFDVEKRLNMQYDNLYKRIRNWAHKQSELQQASGTRDVLLGRIARRLKHTIYWSMFTRWRTVARERRRQAQGFQCLFARHHQSAAHLAYRFLQWRQTALRRKTATLDRSVKETATKNLVLQSEINEQRYIREKELEKKDVLKVKDIRLSNERDELQHFLQLCQQQIADVQGAQSTRLIIAAINMIQHSVGALWSELKDAREAHLQDPCRMLVSSTVLTEHITRPYMHMVEASPEWVKARKDEVKKSRLRFQGMLDSDLLLMWCNYHLAQAHLKVNQEKLEAKFHGATYKYDDPARPYPPHVRTFYSSDASLVRRAENFTSSLQDGEVLLRLLSQISPHLCDVDVLAQVDLEARSRKLLKLLAALSPEAASLLTSMDLTHSFAPDLAAALLARLMMKHTSTPVDTSVFRPRRSKRSEYAPTEPRSLSILERSQIQDMKAMTDQLGVSDAAAKRAQSLMAEEARVDALVAEDKAEEEDQHSLIFSVAASRRGSTNAKAAPPTNTNNRRSSVAKREPPTQKELEAKAAERAVKDVRHEHPCMRLRRLATTY